MDDFAAAAAAVVVLIVACVACFYALRRRRREPAGWTGPFDRAGYRAFAGLVRAYFQARGVEVTIEDGYVVAPNGRYGLQNLAQVCSRQERRAWPEAIGKHFDALHAAEDVWEARSDALSLAEAEDLLAVRLWPAEYLKQVGQEHAIYREDLFGVVTVLVYDEPETIRQVDPAHAAAWGKSTDELFALGIDNLRRKPRPGIQRVELEGGLKVTVFSGNSFFVASEALRLEQFPGVAGRYGALVGVPNRHVLLSYPIDGPDVARAMPLLVPAILGMFRDGPGSISPMLYWFHDGAFDLVPFGMVGNKLQFTPPAGLKRVIEEGQA